MDSVADERDGPVKRKNLRFEVARELFDALPQIEDDMKARPADTRKSLGTYPTAPAAVLTPAPASGGMQSMQMVHLWPGPYAPPGWAGVAPLRRLGTRARVARGRSLMR